METDLRSFALKSALNEVRNLCPDISSAFMFAEDGEITASDESTPEKSMVRIINALDGLLEKAETMGGIELVTIEGSRGGASLSHLGNQYLVTVTSENADQSVNMMTRSIVTTVLKLLEKISPAPLRTNPSETIVKPEESVGHEEELLEQPTEKPEMIENEHVETTGKPENTQSQLVANQFIVEDAQGMLVAADTVRVDRETLQQWEEHENQKVEMVEVETFGGQSIRCKIKPVKDPKLEGKGIVQVPQKIQRLLDIKKGELVKVKPLVEQEGDGP
jgi:hypothetical protein